MSLITDQWFYQALTNSQDIQAIVDDRIFNPARPAVDEDEDKIPYVIITFDGLTNNADTKDDDVEGDEDTVTVSVLCVAENCDALGRLTQLVRRTCREFWRNNEYYELTPTEWQFSAGKVMFDPEKPCCYQTLTYQCSTNNDTQ